MAEPTESTEPTSTEDAAPAPEVPAVDPIHKATLWERVLYSFVRFLVVDVFARLWFRVEVVDRNWVPAHGSYVIAPVHRSNVDFLLVAALTRRRIRYMGKDSLWKWAPFGAFLTGLGAFPVRRGSADREAMRACMQVIELGEPLLMFPEGTRRTGLVVEELFDGPAYVAARAGVPLVPVGIGGSEDAMPKGARWIRPRKVVLVVGEPLEAPKGNGSGRVPRRVVRELTEQLRKDLQSLYDEAQHRVHD